jgi:AraC-like DNA-binding protein
MSRLVFVKDWIVRARRANYDAVHLARLCDISPSQLRRFFLQHYFRPPQEWLNELRLWDATKLLAEGWQIKQIAAHLNFGSDSQFCRCFKRYRGCCPTEFLLIR